MAARPAPTFYILHGDNAFDREAYVAEMRARMDDTGTADLNTMTFDGRNADVADVFNAACAVPFLSDRRLVIVSGWLSWLARSGAGSAGKETLARIVGQLSTLPDTARLVFVEREALKETHPVLKAARADPRGFVRLFALPPLQQVPAWIISRAGHYGITIEPAAAAMLTALSGGDLIRLDGELFKLAAYVGDGGVAREDAVAALTSHTYFPESLIFTMVDAIGQRDSQTALRALHRQLKATGDDTGAVLSLFGMIVRQFRLLIQAREHLDRGRGYGGALAEALRLHKFVAEKIERQSRNFTLRDLEAIYHRLLEIDREVKTGRTDLVLALDVLVAGHGDEVETRE